MTMILATNYNPISMTKILRDLLLMKLEEKEHGTLNNIA